jgi:hypothetical protein
MTKENLRSVVWDAVKAGEWENLSDLHARIKERADERNIPFEDERELEAMANQLIWELMVRGVLTPGGDATYLDFQVLKLTESGMKILDIERHVPESDPGKFIERITEQVNRPIDEIVKIYLRESVLTLMTGYHVATTVMLSVASERLLDILIDEYSKASKKKTGKDTFGNKIKRAGRSTKERFDTLRTDLQKADLPPDMVETVDMQLSGLYTLIRYARNDEGAPSGRAFDQDTAHAGLLLFPQYCVHVYGLINHLQQNGL